MLRFSKNLRSFTGLRPGLPPFKIVDSTLREGEQFATSQFNRHDYIYISKMLSRIGVDYIELTNPIVSQESAKNLLEVTKLNNRKKILTHIRCHTDDLKEAINCGVDGVNIYMATSPILVRNSHKKGIEEIIQQCDKVISLAQKYNLEVRFSCEDSFRSNLKDIIRVYTEVARMGIQRIGIADTVGTAYPSQVYDVVSQVNRAIPRSIEIEFHGHDDTGCAVANAFTALQAGATHIDTCVLGIGERNGIAPLGSFLARMYALDKEGIMQRFDLKEIKGLENYIARVCDVDVPFNNPVTGKYAFTHKAGVHTNAVLNDPKAYEIIDPDDFGVDRKIQLASRLTGWNAVNNRCKKIGLDLPREKVQTATRIIKNLADQREITVEDIDTILNSFVNGKETDLVTLQAPPKEMESSVLKITGHLFDKGVINRVLDILNSHTCKFKIVHLDVPNVDELESQFHVRILEQDSVKVTDTLDHIDQFISSLDDIANCKWVCVLE